jgi:hypothetical protein
VTGRSQGESRGGPGFLVGAALGWGFLMVDLWGIGRHALGACPPGLRGFLVGWSPPYEGVRATRQPRSAGRLLGCFVASAPRNDGVWVGVRRLRLGGR